MAFDGEFYHVHHNGTPKPVQKPHPPILIGGGGRRVLSFAAREADIIGINFNLVEGKVNRATMETGTPEATRQKIAWIREAAGDRMNDIEFNVTVFAAVVTDDRAGMAERLAQGFASTPAEVLEVPHVLVGSVDQICDDLERRREEYGFSYVVVSGGAWEGMGGVVAKLAGR